MKKIIFSIIKLTVILMIFSQNTVLAINVLEKGIKTGVNISNFKTPVYDDIFESKNGLCAGGFIEIYINNIISIQPEMLFTMKGAKSENFLTSESPDPICTYWRYDNLNYLELPVLVKLNLKTKNIIDYYFFGGPTLAMTLSSKYKIKISSEYRSSFPWELDHDLDNVKKIDYGVIIGSGMNFKLKIVTILFEIRYNYGMSNIFKNNYLKLKNNTLSLMMGCSL